MKRFLTSRRRRQRHRRIIRSSSLLLVSYTELPHHLLTERVRFERHRHHLHRRPRRALSFQRPQRLDLNPSFGMLCTMDKKMMRFGARSTGVMTTVSETRTSDSLLFGFYLCVSYLRAARAAKSLRLLVSICSVNHTNMVEHRQRLVEHCIPNVL